MFGLLIQRVTPISPWKIYKPDPSWLAGGSYVWVPIAQVQGQKINPLSASSRI